MSRLLVPLRASPQEYYLALTVFTIIALRSCSDARIYSPSVSVTLSLRVTVDLNEIEQNLQTESHRNGLRRTECCRSRARSWVIR